jgi:hypothetical protein
MLMEIPFPTSLERIPLSNGGMLLNISVIDVVVNSKIGGNRGLPDRLIPGSRTSFCINTRMQACRRGDGGVFSSQACES